MASNQSWIIGWYDDNHGDTLHVAILDKYLNLVHTWDSTYTGAANKKKYFTNALFDPVTGKAVLVGRLQGDSGSSYGIYVVVISSDGHTYTINDQFLTNTGSTSEGSNYVYYYDARGPVAALSSGRLLVAYMQHYKNEVPLEYTVFDLASETIVKSGTIDDTTGGSDSYSHGCLPKVAGGNHEWVVTYVDNDGTVYAVSIDYNGNLIASKPLTTNGDDKNGGAFPVYNGSKHTFIILYADKSAGDLDIYAIRFNASTGALGTAATTISATSGVDEGKPVAYYTGGTIYTAYIGGSIDTIYLTDDEVPPLPAPAGPVLYPGQLNNLATPSLAGRILWVGGKWIAVWVEETDSGNHEGDLWYAVIGTDGSVESSGVIVTNAKDSRLGGGSPSVVVADDKVVVAYTYYDPTTKMDIGFVEIYPNGTVVKAYNITDSGYQEFPTLAYDPSTNKLAVLYYENGAKIAVFDASNIAAGPVATAAIPDNSYYKYFSGDIINYNGYFVGVYINGSYNYGNVTVFVLDESSGSITYEEVIASGYVRTSSSGPYIAYASTADKFLAVWAMDEDANIYASLFSISGGTVTYTNKTMVLDDRAGTTLYPYVVAGPDYWLTVWGSVTGKDDIIGRIVYSNGSITKLIGIATLPNDEDFARELYISSLGTGEFVVLYRNWSTDFSDANITALRINSTGGISAEPIAVTDLTKENGYHVNETPNYVFFNGTHIGLFYTAENDTTKLDPFVKFIDPATIPEPSTYKFMKPTAIFITYWGDEDGDHYIVKGSGERFHVQAKLYWYDEDTNTYHPLTVADQKVTITVQRIIDYDNTEHRTIYEDVVTTVASTNANGEIDAYIDVPSTAISGPYRVVLSYPGNATIGYDKAPDNMTHLFDGTAVMVLSASPGKTIDGNLDDWEQPTHTEAPVLEYKNGELILTDPAGDYRNDTTTVLGGEASDVDITELHIAIDNNYLYIAYKVAGNASIDGSYIPALGIAFDLTPGDSNDGALHGKSYNFRLYYRVYSDTQLKNKRGWDFVVFLTPVLWRSDAPNHELTPAMPILYVWKSYLGGTYDYYEYEAGIVVFSGDTVEAAIPLDALGWAHDNDPAANILIGKNITLFQAVFAMSTSTGKTVDFDGANFVDFAGGVFNATQGFIPAGTLSQGFTNEDWSDKEIDKYLEIAVDNTGKIYGYAEFYLEDIWLRSKDLAYSLTHYKEAYIGTSEWTIKAKDHFNPMFRIPDASITITVKHGADTYTFTGTTNMLGLVNVTVQIRDAWWKDKINVTIDFSKTGYIPLYTKEFSNISVLYFTVIDYFKVNITDKNADGLIDTGDIIYLEAKVYVNDENNNNATKAGIPVTFILHSPEVVLGTVPTDNNGTASLTVPVNTTLGTIIGTHSIEARAGNYTQYYGVSSVSKTPTIKFFVAPAPEPPILPIILLAAILLFIIIKKRK